MKQAGYAYIVTPSYRNLNSNHPPVSFRITLSYQNSARESTFSMSDTPHVSSPSLHHFIWAERVLSFQHNATTAAKLLEPNSKSYESTTHAQITLGSSAQRNKVRRPLRFGGWPS